MEEPASASQPPKRPPPPRPQIRQIKQIRMPESSGNSAREEVYEVYSTSGPPAYYGADGLLLNREQVRALHSSAGELPQTSSVREEQSQIVPPVEKNIPGKEVEPVQSSTKKKKKFSFAKVVRKVVSKSKTGERRKLIEKRSSRSCNTSDSDVALKSFRKGREEKSRLLRPTRSDQRCIDETRILNSDEEGNTHTPRRSRQATRFFGKHRQRITDAENESCTNVISLHRSRFQEEKTSDRDCQRHCEPLLPPGSTYCTSSDMPTELSVSPVPSSEENYVMGLRQSPTASRTSTSSQWSSKESSPERQTRQRNKASQTSFLEDEDTVIEKSQGSMTMSVSKKTLMPEIVTKTIPFCGVLSEEKGAVSLKVQQLPKVRSLSYVVTDERMPVEAPRRSQSQRLTKNDSVPSDNGTVSQLSTFTYSEMPQSTEGQSICICENTESPKRPTGKEEQAEMHSPTEPKRRRWSLVEMSHNSGIHEKNDCGVPNESSADAGLLSEDTEGSWRPVSEEYSQGFDAPLAPIPTGANLNTEMEAEIREKTTVEFVRSNSPLFSSNIERAAHLEESLNKLQKAFSVEKDDGFRKGKHEVCFEGQLKEFMVPVQPKKGGSCFCVAVNEVPEATVLFLENTIRPLVTSQTASCQEYKLQDRDKTVENKVDESTHRMNLKENECFGVSDQCTEQTGYQYDLSLGSEIAYTNAVFMRTPRVTDDGGPKIEKNSVCGIPDHVSSWFAIDSNPRNKYRIQPEKVSLEKGSTIKDGLIQSSKHLAIAVPDQNSIQLLYQGQAKQKESSDTMLEGRFGLFRGQSHRNNEESKEPKEGNRPNPPCEATSDLRKDEGTMNTSFVDVNSKSKGDDLRKYPNAISKDRSDLDSGKCAVMTENSTENLRESRPFIFQMSKQSSSKSNASDKEAHSKNQVPSKKSADSIPDSNRLILVACSRKGSHADQILLQQEKEGEDTTGALHQSGILIELDHNISTFSVASGVASVGFLCLKEYSQNTNSNARANKHQVPPKGSSRGQRTITPTKSKQRDGGMSYTPRKRAVFRFPKWKRQNKVSLQKFASSQDCVKADVTSVADNSKDAASVPNATLYPVLPEVSLSNEPKDIDFVCPSDSHGTTCMSDIPEEPGRVRTAGVAGMPETSKGQVTLHETMQVVQVPGDQRRVDTDETIELGDMAEIQQRVSRRAITGSTRVIQKPQISESGTADFEDNQQLMSRDGTTESVAMAKPCNNQWKSREGSSHTQGFIRNQRWKSEDRTIESDNAPNEQQPLGKEENAKITDKWGMSGRRASNSREILRNQMTNTGGTTSVDFSGNQQGMNRDKTAEVPESGRDKQMTKKDETTRSDDTTGKQKWVSEATTTEFVRFSEKQQGTDQNSRKESFEIPVEQYEVSRCGKSESKDFTVGEENMEGKRHLCQKGITELPENSEKQKTMNRDGTPESSDVPCKQKSSSRGETSASAEILGFQHAINIERKTKSAEISVNDQPVNGSHTAATRGFPWKAGVCDNFDEISNKRQPLSNDTTTAPDLSASIKKLELTRRITRKSIPCLGLVDWTSTDTSLGSADIPMPSEIDFENSIPDNGTRRDSDVLCSTRTLNEITSEGLTASAEQSLCPVAEVPVNAASSDDHKRFEMPPTVSSEARPAMLVDKMTLSSQTSSPKSVYYEADEGEDNSKAEFNAECNAVAEVKDDGADSCLTKDPAADTDKDTKPVVERPLNTERDLESCGRNAVSHGTVEESTGQSNHHIETISKITTGREVTYEKRENVSSASGSSGKSIQSESFPSTFNLNKGISNSAREEFGDRPQPTPRTLHKYRVENLFDYSNSSPGVRPPSAGDYTSDGEFTERQRYLYGSDSVMGESLVTGQVPFVHRRLPNQYRIRKAQVLEQRDWTVSDPEGTTSNVFSDEITLPLASLLGLIDKNPQNLEKLINIVTKHLSIGDEQITTAVPPKLYQSPEKLYETGAWVGDNVESTESSSQGAGENSILDRRKFPVGCSGGCVEPQHNGSCGDSRDIVGLGSTYRISQNIVAPEMGISLSQLTTNVYRRDQRTVVGGLSSKSSSSYNCCGCDCSANQQTSVEDSSCGTGNLCKRSIKKSRKERDESELGSPSSFQSNSSVFTSATSGSADFLHTSDFESGETSTAASTTTGASGAYSFVSEENMRIDDTINHKRFHRIQRRFRKGSCSSEEFNYDADIEDSVDAT